MSTAAHLDTYEEGLRLSAKGQHALAIERFEQALSRSPDDVRVLFALGNTARALDMAGAAEEFFRRVLVHDPRRLEALINLSNLLRTQGKFSDARALLTPALADSPESAELWLTLGSVYREIGDRVRACEHYRAALARRPDYALALGNLADLLADDGETDEALVLYDRALRREKDNAQALMNRAVLHLRRGDLKSGWRDYAARLRIPGKVPIPDHKLARWSGSSLKRQRLLITAEQGIGDQIMFASMLPDLAARAMQDGGSLILECEPRLAALFARSFPSITVKGWDSETRGGVAVTRYSWLKSAGGATSAIEIGSLPRFLRAELEAFPKPNIYLVPDVEEVSRWRNIFPNRPTIGICWRSGKTGGHRSLQYAPLEAWAGFLRELSATIVSVQYDATHDEIARLEYLSGKEILIPQGIDQKNQLDRTCGLIAALDAVISAPTAVSWLAASAGIPTFKVLYDTSWTSFGEAYEPFAPACACVSPTRRGDWQDCFAKAHGALNAQLSMG